MADAEASLPGAGAQEDLTEPLLPVTAGVTPGQRVVPVIRVVESVPTLAASEAAGGMSLAVSIVITGQQTAAGRRAARPAMLLRCRPGCRPGRRPGRLLNLCPGCGALQPKQSWAQVRWRCNWGHALCGHRLAGAHGDTRGGALAQAPHLDIQPLKKQQQQRHHTGSALHALSSLRTQEGEGLSVFLTPGPCLVPAGMAALPKAFSILGLGFATGFLLLVGFQTHFSIEALTLGSLVTGAPQIQGLLQRGQDCGGQGPIMQRVCS